MTKHTHENLSNVVIGERWRDSENNVIISRYCQGCGEELSNEYAESVRQS